MNTVLLRAPSANLHLCQTTFIERDPPDAGLAAEQHEALAEILRSCNYTVITLPPVPELPDSVFLEDTAVPLPEGAVLLPMGTGSRWQEPAMVQGALRIHFADLQKIRHPARIEGGDVLRIGRRLFVGLSSRTDSAGADALAEIASKWRYEINTVRVTGSLHLKTAATALDDSTVLLNPAWVDSMAFRGYRIVEVDPEEPFAANVLRLTGGLVVHKGFANTNERLREFGYQILEADISEFLKVEAGLTCLCLLID